MKQMSETVNIVVIAFVG